MKAGVVVGVVLGFIIVAAAVVVVALASIVPWTREVSSQSLITSPNTTNAPTTSFLPVNPSPPSSTLPTTPPETSVVPTGRVNFVLTVTNFRVNGFSADVTAQVFNNGNANAHNVQAQIQAISGGAVVQVNSSDSYFLPIGSINAQQTVTVNTTLSFNILDTLKISSNGATIYLWLVSDENAQSFSYDYHP
jgi:archaellum component FlaF (FlaF/FlaG flagellin family)